MKLKRTLLLTGCIIFSLLSTACARDRALDGLIIGSGGGALVGQAIGHDTESTVIGATVGGILGYMIGNNSYYSVHRRYNYIPAHSYGRNHYRHYSPRIIKKRHHSYHRPGKMRRQHVRVTKHGSRKRISQKKIRNNSRNGRHNRGYERYNR